MISKKGELLRDDENGKIAGVCAGIADYFGWELWLVRIITVSAFFLGGSGIIFVLYIAAWVVLEKKSKATKHSAASNGTTAYADRPVELKTRVWQRGESPKQALQHLNHQFNSMELKLRDMERHVTSNRFQLNREFNNL